MTSRFERLKERLNQKAEAHSPLLNQPSASPSLERIKARLSSPKANFSVVASAHESATELPTEAQGANPKEKNERHLTN